MKNILFYCGCILKLANCDVRCWKVLKIQFLLLLCKNGASRILYINLIQNSIPYNQILIHDMIVLFQNVYLIVKGVYTIKTQI